jgi:uncharacterized protein YacL
MKREDFQAPFTLPQRMVMPFAQMLAKAIVDHMPRRRKRKVKSKLDGSFILDTSAIIDGRISDVAKLGFLSGIVIVPEFVLVELKRVADSSDSLKRTRGRRGLDLLNDMKKYKEFTFKVYETTEDFGKKEVDERLIALTKKLKAKLVTVDYNLNKKASVQGVRVLNINDLANLLKTIALPGETIKVDVVSEGKGKNQGVGYLVDGTMIVVEEGSSLIGKEAEVTVSRVFQTPAGRMIFAKVPHTT